jgi:hypothetical protein
MLTVVSTSKAAEWSMYSAYKLFGFVIYPEGGGSRFFCMAKAYTRLHLVFWWSCFSESRLVVGIIIINQYLTPHHHRRHTPKIFLPKHAPYSIHILTLVFSLPGMAPMFLKIISLGLLREGPPTWLVFNCFFLQGGSQCPLTTSGCQRECAVSHSIAERSNTLASGSA